MIRRFDVLIALYIFGVLVAELMGAKTVALPPVGGLHLHASVALLVMPLLFTATDVMVEVYGRARARSVVLSGLLMVVLLALFSTLAVALPPSSQFAAMQPAYAAIFATSVRFSLASIAAFAVSELLDVALFHHLRRRLHGRALWLRNNASNIVSQGADSLVFMTLAFFSPSLSFGSNIDFIAGLLIPYWLFRCALSILETPLVYLGVWWLRREPVEGTEILQPEGVHA